MCGSAGSGGKDKAMITLYGGPTPNARKIAIALLEMGLEWRLDPVDILAGDQLTPEFLALNPNNNTPVIVDDAGPQDRKSTRLNSSHKCAPRMPAYARKKNERAQVGHP